MENMRFKVGDHVRIKSLDWYNENKDKNGHVKCGTATFDVNMQIYCGSITTIYAVDEIGYDLDVDWGQNVWTDEMIEGLVDITQDRVDKLACKIDKELPSGNQNVWELPDGYQFTDENGNVINATKIVLEKKKKEYPKTYEECCKIMQVARHTIWFDYDDVSSISKEGDEYECHIENTLCAFRKLIICLHAYWKIAGEEMGLGKPWKPVYQDDRQDKHCIYVDIWGITLRQDNIVQHVLSFPTKEMRDAFYENFKELIEQCKELL